MVINISEVNLALLVDLWEIVAAKSINHLALWSNDPPHCHHCMLQTEDFSRIVGLGFSNI